MAKILQVAAAVVGVIAAPFSGGTSLALSAAALGLNIAAQIAAASQTPVLTGSQSEWQSDPNAPGIITLGRTYVGGKIIYRKSWGKKNCFRTLVTILSSCGPIQGVEAVLADKKPLVFDGETAHGITYDRYWQRTQLGRTPEPVALTTSRGMPPGWTAAHKLSGYAACMDTFKFDGEGKSTFTQHPELGRIVLGVMGYDPRLDSTYPGGSGPCRANDRSTWVYSESPPIMGLTFALGWKQGPNNVRVGGVGMPIELIDVPAFVQAANIADANGWKVGGQVTTRDDKWEVMKAILQAGGAKPIRQGALLSCVVNAPKIPLATITIDQLIGEASIATAQTTRDRVNGIIPRYRSEANGWEMVPASCIRSAAYLTLDGTEKTKEIEYPLVQCRAGFQPKQVAQLAAYDLCDAREAGPIVLPLRLRWFGFRAGDCLQVADEPEWGWLRGRRVVVERRALDAESASAPLTLRTETSSKHAYALGQDGTAAPVTDLGNLPDFDAPEAGEWAMSGATVDGAGATVPALVFLGASGDSVATQIMFSYYQGTEAPASDDDWIISGTVPNGATRHVNTSVGSGLSYMGSVQYLYRTGLSERLILGPVTAGNFAVGGGGARRLLTISVAYPLSSNDDSISILPFTGVIDTGAEIDFPAGSIGGLANGSSYGVFWSIASGSYLATLKPSIEEMASPDLVFLGWQATSTAGTYPDGPTAPPGGGGYNPSPNLNSSM